MQHPVSDLLSPSLVPELASDAAAGAPGHVHLRLVHVPALWRFPQKLAIFLDDLNLTVPAADLTVVALGVQLGVGGLMDSSPQK